MVDDLTAVAGIHVGHATDPAGQTGVTAVLCPPAGAVFAVDVRGGGPATSETDVARPGNLVERAHAILLCGGSAFGLAAAAGARDWLAGRGIGFPTVAGPVPIVPAAALFDLATGQPARPTPEMGAAACAAAAGGPVEQGRVGAGTGCNVAKLLGTAYMEPGGLGSAAVAAGDWTVGALVAVNAVGEVRDPVTGRAVAGAGLAEAFLRADTPAAGPGVGENTTLVVVATDAPLSRDQCCRLAAMAHDGLARTLFPAHTPFDGDIVFALATGCATGPVDATGLARLGTAAVLAVERAVLRACRY